jgi:hypothetical protein
MSDTKENLPCQRWPSFAAHWINMDRRIIIDNRKAIGFGETAGGYAVERGERILRGEN